MSAAEQTVHIFARLKIFLCITATKIYFIGCSVFFKCSLVISLQVDRHIF